MHNIPRTVLFATSNRHKVAEMADLLAGQVRVDSTGGLPIRLEVQETGATFAENATLKALAWARAVGQLEGGAPPSWVLADDSGLEVDALGGAPGVHSARFAALDQALAGNSPDAENNAKLLRLLADVPAGRRTARFRCVLALVSGNGGETRLFSGVCEGALAFAAAGSGGFGYDPLFIPEGFDRSLAELGPEVKQRISHRARAAAGLKAWLACAGPTTPHCPAV